jgi:hypothetical protein
MSSDGPLVAEACSTPGCCHAGYQGRKTMPSRRLRCREWNAAICLRRGEFEELPFKKRERYFRRDFGYAADSVIGDDMGMRFQRRR